MNTVVNLQFQNKCLNIFDHFSRKSLLQCVSYECCDMGCKPNHTLLSKQLPCELGGSDVTKVSFVP